MEEPEAELPSPKEAPPEDSAWQETWTSLRNEAHALEENFDGTRLLGNTRSQQELQLAWHGTQMSLDRWSGDLWANLGSLRADVKKLQASPRASEPCQTPQDVKQTFESFKAQHREEFESLVAEQKLLEDALASSEKHFDGWLERGVPSSPSKCRSQASDAKGPLDEMQSECRRSASSTRKAFLKDDPELLQLKAELKVLNEAEAQETANGGWATADHEVFVRILRIFRMQATPQCYTRLASHFPDLQEADLADHFRWVSDFQSRQAKRRLLLVRWRERRSRLESQASAGRKELQDQKHAQSREQSREQQRRRVQAWREAREEEESRIAAEQREHELEKARQERRRQKRHQKQLKEFAQAYRKQREAEKQQARLSVDATRRALSEEDRNRIEQRNLSMLAKKLQATVRHAGATPQANQRCNLYDYVKSRLHDPTQSFVQKTAPKEEEAP